MKDRLIRLETVVEIVRADGGVLRISQGSGRPSTERG